MMKKKLLAWILALLMLLPLISAQADYGTLYMVVDCYSAPMYAGYGGNSALLRYVNAGEIVYCIAALDNSYCVAYENSLGYIDEQYLAAVDDRYYDFRLPNNGEYTAPGGNQYLEYRGTSYFTYAPLDASANQKLATRSGPGTNYTDTLTYPQSTDISVYYTTAGSGVDWVYIGFTYRGEDYLLYTGRKRVSVNGVIPGTESEDGFAARITQDLTPYYGPGYNYALAKQSVPAGSAVTGFYQSIDGWLMFDYQIPGGKIQRAWAPAGSWN